MWCFVVLLQGIALLALALVGLHYLGKQVIPKRGKFRPSELERWRAAESRDVIRPRDPRTRFCLEHLGQPITLTYHDRRRIVTPLRVFTKPKFHKTYVLADDGGEQKNFDIDDITEIVGLKKLRAPVPRSRRRPAAPQVQPTELVENPGAAARDFLADILGQAKPAPPEEAIILEEVPEKPAKPRGNIIVAGTRLTRQ